ncbi:hypothetical protein [Ferdinandcohnia sp. Marseille-Q9671]
MFVKVYSYHIQPAKNKEFVHIQKRTSELYGRYIDVQTTYLQSSEDQTKWLEISKYRSEEDYLKSIQLINNQKEIQDLFLAFQSILEQEKITEENFTEIRLK